MMKIVAALEAVSNGLVDGSIQFTHKRQSSDEPYHKANVLISAALARLSAKGSMT